MESSFDCKDTIIIWNLSYLCSYASLKLVPETKFASGKGLKAKSDRLGEGVHFEAGGSIERHWDGWGDYQQAALGA